MRFYAINFHMGRVIRLLIVIKLKEHEKKYSCSQTFCLTLWEHRKVLKIYTRGISIGPRYLHFRDISDLQNSLIFRKIAFIRPVRQLEFRRKASVMGIRNSHIVKNRGQHAKEWCYVVHPLPFSSFSLVLTFFYFFFSSVHIRI